MTITDHTINAALARLVAEMTETAFAFVHEGDGGLGMTAKAMTVAYLEGASDLAECLKEQLREEETT